MTYDEAIAEAADGIDMGSDHMADAWGPALELKLGRADYYDDPTITDEQIDLARTEVFIDIFKLSVESYQRRLAEMRGTEFVPPLTAEELDNVASILFNEGDRLGEFEDEDSQDEADECGIFAARLSAVARSMR